MKKWIQCISAILIAVLAFGGWLTYTQMQAAGFWRTPAFETVPPEIPALHRPAALVFSRTNGFIHKEAIPAAKAMLQQIAKRQAWSIYFTDNGAVHNPEDLAKFDVVVWNNVSGDVLTADQRAALQNYLNGGGGFVGLHATGGDFEYAWKWQPETLIKAHFIGHPMSPQFQTATISIEDRDDPIVKDLGSEWVREDEWYSFAQSPRVAGVHVLATLDEKTYKQKMYFKSISMGDDHPIMWKHCIGKGRVFYSALGHTAETYQDPKYINVIARALTWAAKPDNVLCDAQENNSSYSNRD